jgi:hypothetical protein
MPKKSALCFAFVLLALALAVLCIPVLAVDTELQGQADHEALTEDQSPLIPPSLDLGDAPEGPTAIAYPVSGVFGSFPTCMNAAPAGWVQHTNFGAWLGPAFDLEYEGNAGACPSCFPPYDVDECFADGDAGLLFPEPFTIDASGSVQPCPLAPMMGTPLGGTCMWAQWGVEIDIDVHNHMPSATTGYMNVLIDWDQDGQWGGSSVCAGLSVPEHVLVDFPIPNPFDGPLSALGPPNFRIGPNTGHVWARFSITESPVGFAWDGSGAFEDGESEDYLLLIVQPPRVQVIKRLADPISGLARISDTITYTINIANIGPTPVVRMPLWDYSCPSCLKLTSWDMDPTLVDDILGVVHWADVLDPSLGGPGILLPGQVMTVTLDYHAHVTDTMYWKEAGWLDYAPKGMPDIDQKQNGWDNPAGSDQRWFYCGPVAAANSLWWFDSKFELAPVIPPPTINDTYPLVQSYSPLTWDDHDQRNVPHLVTALAVQMGTTAGTGTNVHNMASGLVNYINSKGLGTGYTVQRKPDPDFGWVEQEVQSSEDVILLLGFWQDLPTAGWTRLGGHYVTVAGIDSRNELIAFSDPYYDRAEGGWQGRVLPNPHGGLHPWPGPVIDSMHNDTKFASHDVYDVTDTHSPGGHWGPANYATGCSDIQVFLGQNEGDFANGGVGCDPSVPVFAEVEYAVAVSPITPTLLCKPTDNFAVVSGAVDAAGVKVPESQGHAWVIVNKAPALGPVTPASGGGTTGVTSYFTTTWRDANGWADLKQCYFHIGASPSIVGNVTLMYNNRKNKMWIRTDDGSAWAGGFAPGSAAVLDNSQARVYCSLSTAQGMHKTLEVKWAIEFKAGYTGPKKTGLKCKDLSKAKAKGEWKGTWTIF